MYTYKEWKEKYGKMPESERSWKAKKLAHLVIIYGPSAESYESLGADDDRKLMINMYRMCVEALESLDEDPNTLVRVAMNRQLKEYRDMMDEIISRFG